MKNTELKKHKLTSLSSLFLPETHALVAPPPQVSQLEAVVTATAEQLAMVGADVQRGDFTLSRKLLNAADRPDGDMSAGYNATRRLSDASLMLQHLTSFQPPSAQLRLKLSS